MVPHSFAIQSAIADPLKCAVRLSFDSLANQRLEWVLWSLFPKVIKRWLAPAGKGQDRVTKNVKNG